MLPDVLAPAHCAHLAGTESAVRFAGAGSLWPDPFPPSPPPPVARRCSGTSQAVLVGPTSRARSSSAYVLRLPDASRHCIGGGRTQDLPVLVRSVSVRARGLRPRGTRAHLAISMRPVVPSDYPYSVGVPNQASFAAQYPARTYPCLTLRPFRYRKHRMTRGRCGSLALQRVTLSFTTLRRFIPALSGRPPYCFCLRINFPEKFQIFWLEVVLRLGWA